MAGRIPRAWLILFVVGALLAAALGAVLFVPGWRPRDVLFDRWLREVPSLPDAQVLPRIRQLANFGDDRLPALVPLLASERPTVASAARMALAEQVDRWKLLPPEKASRNVGQLARALAAIIDELDSTNRTFAHDVATRLLLWPVDSAAVDTAALIADCESVLRAPPRFDARSEPLSLATGRGPARRAQRWLLDPLPDPAADKTAAQVPERENPSFSETRPPLIPPRTVNTTDDESLDSMDAVEMREPPPLNPPRGVTPIVPRRIVPPNWRGVNDWDVMQQLNAEDVATASAAMTELRRRGFKERDFELAAQLFDPDPRVREWLAESLPELSGVDARPWLLWLSRDPHPTVRRAAIAVIATSADPELRNRLREIEREDSDPEIVQQVQRMLR